MSLLVKSLKIVSIFILFLFALVGCYEDESDAPDLESEFISFGQPQKVKIEGYTDHIMEPFLSRDGNILIFNNLNDPAITTNLHYAVRTNDSIFDYQGELRGINTEFLEGVPSMSNTNKLYFVSTRTYEETFSTIYEGDFSNGAVSNLQLVSNISKKEAGWVNFDVEVSADGNLLCFVDGRFDEQGGPYESDLAMAFKSEGTFHRTENTSLLENVNTDALEYAACISADMLELYFTRLELPVTSFSVPQIYLATRHSTSEPFKKPCKISVISGFVEGPTISPDGQSIYYHKIENEKYVLYRVCKN